MATCGTQRWAANPTCSTRIYEAWKSPWKVSRLPVSAAERSAIPRSTVNTAFDAKAEFLVEDRCQIDEVVNELKGRMVWRGLTDEIANADFDALQREVAELENQNRLIEDDLKKYHGLPTSISDARRIFEEKKSSVLVRTLDLPRLPYNLGSTYKHAKHDVSQPGF